MGPLWTIRVETWINAPMERCFEIALRVETHGGSALIERVIDGPGGSGDSDRCMHDGDQLTRESKHFGKKIRYTTRIEQVRPFTYFREMRVSGALSRYEHDHHFAPMDDGTRMRDEICFAVPMGGLGKLATKMFLRKRLTAVLRARSHEIKRLAESDIWKKKVEEPLKAVVSAQLDEEKKAAQRIVPKEGRGGPSVLRGSEKFS